MATFTNQAFLSYNGRTTASNITRGEIVGVLTVTKTALNPNYNSGSVITYIVNIINSGCSDFTDLTLHDDLGAYEFTPECASKSTTLFQLKYVDCTLHYYLDGEEQPTPQISTECGLTVKCLTVPAHGNTTLIYQAEVTEFAPLSDCGQITNTATLSGDCGFTPIEASATVDTSVCPQLSIVKCLYPKTVSENCRITYTFDIQNIGNSAACECANVQVTDTFDPILKDITVTYNGDTLDPSYYCYNETTGLFTTKPGVITVPAATFTQDPKTGEWTVIPGESILEITGNIS